MKKLLKVPPTECDDREQSFDLDYYLSLDTATRFRMIIERSILLYRLANESRHASDPESPALAKRI